MAGRASRGELVAAFGGLTMQACRMLFLFGRMTIAAVDGLKLFRMGKLFPRQILMTTRTFEAGMRRGSQRRGIEWWGNTSLALARGTSRLVAHRAIFGTGKRLRLLGEQAWDEQCGQQEETCPSMQKRMDDRVHLDCSLGHGVHRGVLQHPTALEQF